MAHAKIKRLVPLLVLPERPRVPIGDKGVRVPDEFGIKVELAGGFQVTIDVAAAHGRARATAVHIVERDGGGVTGLTVDRVSIDTLLREGVSAVAWISNRHGSPDVRDAARKSTRQRIDAARLERIAALIAVGGTEGEINRRIMDAEGFTDERQARRLKKRVREGQ